MQTAAAAGAGAALLGSGATRANPLNLVLPSLGIETKPSRTPVEHLVVVMMENRSVDHYLGWYGAENPDFDATQDGAFVDLRQGPDGPVVATEPWGERGRQNFHGREFADPSHSWSNRRTVRNGGALDGWLHPETGNDLYTLSIYDADDLPVWRQLARGWQTYDRWFASVLGPTQPNRYYLHSAQSGGLKNNDLPPQLAGEHPEWIAGFDWPTLWTLFEQAGITCGYYFSNLPELAFWGARHLRHARHISDFYLAATTGTLPQVSIVDPWFIAPEGLANDDHPHADLRLGQTFLSDLVSAFTSSPQYRRSAMVITYDEWGGFWDHVGPPRAPDDRATDDDPAGEDDFAQLGFRIPSSIISPWTRGPRVDHTVYEHSSIGRFIADNWGLAYLNARHAGTNSIETAFRGFADFDPDPGFVRYTAPLELTFEPTIEDLQRNLGGSVSDLHLLADTGWFDDLPVRTDWRFEDSFLSPSTIRQLIASLGF